jgi:spermidine/putrescine transport system ATP-binding protein
VLLLDEPLGALDLKLRREMQQELKAIQREVGVTFVFVTHDQEEAMTMSDRIAVMSRGRLQQLGRPREIYDYPANSFVAGFIGASNLLDGVVGRDGIELIDGVTVRTGHSSLPVGTVVVVSIRPEKITLAQTANGDRAHLQGEVVDSVYLGALTHVSLRIAGGQRILAMVPHGSDLAERLAPGASAVIQWRPDDMTVLEQATVEQPTVKPAGSTDPAQSQRHG